MANATLGDLELFVNEEDPTYSNDITDKPIEDGADLADHINNSPVKLRINFTVHRNARAKIDKLEEMRKSKEVFDYNGVMFNMKNMGIESFNIPVGPEIKDGFSTSMTLKQVRIIEKQGSSISLGKDPVTGQEVQKDNKETPKRQMVTANVPEDNIPKGA